MGIPIEKDYLIAPSANVGWLYRENKAGVDVAISAAIADKKDKDGFSLSLPKAQYLTFLSGNKSSTNYGAYFGVGGSFYNLYGDSTVYFEKDYDELTPDERREYDKDREVRFSGLAAIASVGYLYDLGEKLQSSIQLSANMPTPLAISSKGDVYKPSFELSLGLGF